MDIFVIKITDSIDEKLLKQFQKKEISDKKKWLEHCLSYLMLDRILKEVYQIEDREIIFKDGKPVLRSGEKHFSISHGGKYITLGFSDSNCGIDIEEVKERDYKAIAKRMGFVADTLEEFYQEWTKYEAEYKLAGKSNSLKSFKVDNYIITAVSNQVNIKFKLNRLH